MDLNTWRSLSPLLMFIAFIGICGWAFAPKRKARFEEAANLPFADEENDDFNDVNVNDIK